jgi:putative transcriptional regulator
LETALRNCSHHPKDQSLAAFAAGRMDEARGVVIATHLSRCARCREQVRDYETIGGLLLADESPAPMRDSALDSFWLRAGEQDRTPARSLSHAANDAPIALAAPLSFYLKDGVDGVEWRSVAPGIAQHVIPAKGYRPGVLRLLKIAPGVKLPKHTHGDEEFTLILRGAYEDEFGRFEEGDLADLDRDDTHAPVARGDEACICLIATSAPLVFKDLVGKVMQPFIRL